MPSASQIGSGGEGGIGLSVPELEGEEDAGSMSVASAHSINTVCRSPVQGPFVKKRRRFMLESVDRANRIKCDINNIGEARLQAGPLIRMI